jgi:cell division transport system ATP-binding protein
MIKFDNVTATYSNTSGIFNLSFEISAGEIVFLMGPTGSGKSTVLRTIYKEINIEKGKIMLDGEDISNIKQRNIPFLRRKIGMIFQDFKLIPDRSVYENIALPLRISGVKSKYIKEEVMEMCSKVGLKNKEKFYPLNLSGGEQQRVSIARALIKKPSIILADEPTGNLDPVISDDILDIMEIATDNGAAVLMATHNFPLIRPRKKRFIELNQGQRVN